MTYNPAQGPLGLAGRHTWNDAFTINDTAGGLPHVNVDNIAGLFSLPDFDDLRDPRVGASGEVLYPSFTRGKTITYDGRLIAVDTESLNAYRWSMLNSFAERSNEGTMKITPHLLWGTGGWSYKARVLALEIDEEIITDSLTVQPSPYQVHFILSLRMRDNTFTQI